MHPEHIRSLELGLRPYGALVDAFLRSYRSNSVSSNEKLSFRGWELSTRALNTVPCFCFYN
jgi:hypothetical protein